MDAQLDEPNRKVNALISKSETILSKKYEMRAMGVGIAMPSGILKGLGFSFQIQGPKSKESLRKILIEAGQDFLTLINADMAIRPYMEKYPFTIKDISIDLFVMDQNGYDVHEPYIGIADVIWGKLHYKTFKNTEMPQKLSEFEETYEQALEELKKS